MRTSKPRWEPLGRTSAPYAVFVQLLDVSQLEVKYSPDVWARRETYPGLGNRPTDRWPLQQAFCDKVFVYVFAEAPTPLGAAIEVGFTDPEHTDRLQATDPDPMDLAIVGRVPALSPQELPTARRPAQYILDNAIGLNDIQLSGGIAGSATLTLTWQSLRAVQYDATMFIHLRGAQGEMLAQVDRPPLDGRFPTSYWLPGQVVTDAVSLELPSGARRGPLTLNVGMYRWPSLERLPVADAAGAAQPDSLVTVEVPSLLK